MRVRCTPPPPPLERRAAAAAWADVTAVALATRFGSGRNVWATTGGGGPLLRVSRAKISTGDRVRRRRRRWPWPVPTTGRSVSSFSAVLVSNLSGGGDANPVGPRRFGTGWERRRSQVSRTQPFYKQGEGIKETIVFETTKFRNRLPAAWRFVRFLNGLYSRYCFSI